MPIFLLSTLFLVAGIVVTLWIHRQGDLEIVVERASSPPHAPLISLCVPARNEERNIGPCIEAILSQTYPNTEVIVVDDRSTDSTAVILRDLRSRASGLQVVDGLPLPPGWAGKPHALHQAAAVARGEWLCFVDADTFLAPEAVSSCYAKALETRADMFTILTRQLTGTFWERVLMPLVVTALAVAFPPHKVNDPRRRDAIANGQFILIRRSAYDAVGGHARIKDQIVDDKALAQLVKWNGYRLLIANGTPLARTRMYTSLAQMWEGWTKNVYLGLRDQLPLLLLGVFGALLLVIAALILPIWPLLGFYWYRIGGGLMALMVIAESLLLWGAVLYARLIVAHKMGIPLWYALTTPLGCGVFAAIMLTSAWKVLSGRGVTWRGRKYNPA